MRDGKDLYNAIKEYDAFMAELEATDKKEIVMARQHQKQEDFKHLQKIVRKYKGEYRINQALKKEVESAKWYKDYTGKTLPKLQEYMERLGIEE